MEYVCQCEVRVGVSVVEVVGFSEPPLVKCVGVKGVASCEIRF